MPVSGSGWCQAPERRREGSALAVDTMNSNAAVFGLQESAGYGSPGGGYPTPEQLQAFYAAGGVASSGTVPSSGGGGGGGSTTEPGSPSPYDLQRQSQPETKYDPSHSPTHTQSGIISSDNGLQYANLDGSAPDLKAYPGSAYSSSHPHQAAYQGHHASLLQASYAAHHYGKLASWPRLKILYQKIDNYFFPSLPSLAAWS